MFHSSIIGSTCLILATCTLLIAAPSLTRAQLYDDDSNELGTAVADSSPPVQPIEAPVFQPRPRRPSYPNPEGSPMHDPSEVFVPRLGVVRGKVPYKRINNREISAFLGLKYGVVGRGLARFQRATVVESNSNAIIDATREPSNCPQFPDLPLVAAAEARGENVVDCLTLNIFTPKLTGAYPVMVFVHGEMLFDGSAEEGQPDYFMERDVVLVSVNYRVAPFGFLSTLSDGIPGNAALADIQMALEWVQQYIRPFNGDPARVTLFGQAGGATLAHALSLNSQSDDLFHKLILQSGTALNPYFLDDNALTTARSLARIAHCPVAGVFSTTELQSLNSCFERLTATELLNTFKRHWDENEPRGLRSTGGFKLTIGDRLGYLPTHPAALVAGNSRPMVVGVTKDAGAFIMSRFYTQLEHLYSNNITDYINVVLKHTAPPRHHPAWWNLAMHQIFTNEDVRNPNLQNLAQGLLELTNLILYRGPIIDSVRHTSKKSPTYLYCFDYRGEFHRFGHLRNPLPFEADATLSDDNIYLFPYPEDVSRLNVEDKAVARRLTSMWVNFATYGVPEFDSVLWPNVTSEYGPFVRLTNSKIRPMEVDAHFGEGIPVPNLYPEFFARLSSSSSSTSIMTTTTATPPRANPYYPGYRDYQNYEHERRQQQLQQQRARHPSYRAHETVLNDMNTGNY